MGTKKFYFKSYYLENKNFFTLNKMISDNTVTDNELTNKKQKHNLELKVWILLLLFAILFVVVAIIFANYFNVQNQSSIHVNQKTVIEHDSDEKVYSNNKIKAVENIKRILSDIQINTWNASDQRYPSISSLSDGNFVVIWQSSLENGDTFDIYGQIFYSNGAKKGNEFHVSIGTTTSNQTNPNVASSSDKFMVIWEIELNIFGQIFINNGTKFNDQFQINTIIKSSNGFPPSITALENNDFVAAWDDNQYVYFQIFTDNGTKIISQFNNLGGNSPFIRSLANDNFVLTYRCYPSTCAIIVYSNGNVLKSQFIVNTYIHSDYYPSVSSISNSNFMIVWESLGQDIIGGTGAFMDKVLQALVSK